MEWVTFILGAVIAISVLVVVHEFGHFIVAKLFGVGVPVFSIGMGPRVFGFQFKGTDYRISAVPVGGYVRMTGTDPFGEEDFEEGPPVDPEKDFMRRPIWKRLLIMAAGPIANLILPFVVFTTLFLIGSPEIPPVLGHVSYDSPAWRAGLRSGDRVVAVDGEQVDVYRQLRRAMVSRTGLGATLTVERGSDRLDVALPQDAWRLDGPATVDVRSFGVTTQRLSTRVGIDDPESPAGKAGLESFDAIVAVDGEPVETWYELRDALTPGRSHDLDVLRADRESPSVEELDLTLSPSAAWAARPGDPWANPWGLVPSDVFAGTVSEGDPADRAGVEPGDRLYAINGQPVHDLIHLMALIKGAAGEDLDDPNALTLSVIRNGEQIDETLVPALLSEPTPYGTRTRPIVGVGFAPQTRVDPTSVYHAYGPVDAAVLGMEQTVDVVKTIFAGFDSLLRMKSDPRDMVGGPVAIASITGRSLAAGFYPYLNVIAVISISLAIVNLLPVPALDGGQIVVLLIEWVRGRPLSAEIRMRIQMVGVLMLFALIVLVTVNDIGRHLF